MKAISKSSHLKVIGLHFLSKFKKKKKTAKEVPSLVKLQLVKNRRQVSRKTSSQLPFTGKLTKKIVKLSRILQRHKLLSSIVNVKHEFHLESR